MNTSGQRAGHTGWLILLALAALATDCVDETSCSETATCPPTPAAELDGGMDSGRGDTSIAADSPVTADARDEQDVSIADAGRDGDASIGNDAAVDAPLADGALEAGKGDALVDSSVGRAADAGDAADALIDTAFDAIPDSPTCTNDCTLNTTQCASGAVQTCQPQANGCTRRVTTTTCSAHQTCVTSSGGSAACQCNASVCTQVGKQCDGQNTLVTCATDGQCFYASSSMACAAPTICSGQAPNAACSLTCTDSCTKDQTACGSSGVQTCTLGSNGCYSYTLTTTCVGAQTCSVSNGKASCNCNNDAACQSTQGNTCSASSNATSYVTCQKDVGGCYKQTGTTTCANGACTGAPGAASCCTNLCTGGTVRCGSTTTVETCQVQSGACTTWNSQSCAAGNVCERRGGVSCVDPNWAEWPMPNTPPDVPQAPNPANYTDGGDGTVTDNVTALIWQKGTSATAAWAVAATYCTNLGLAGHSDWRLPTFIELVSIIDYGKVSPSAESTYFPDTTEFWSSTPAASAPSSNALTINFNTGQTMTEAMSTAFSVRCVR